MGSSDRKRLFLDDVLKIGRLLIGAIEPAAKLLDAISRLKLQMGP